MKRGTTPTHRFVLPFSVAEIKEVEITYCQNKREVLKKHEQDCEFDGMTVSTTLSQEDTFAFLDGTVVEIQIRVETMDGTVFASDIFAVSCQRCLSEEVL